MKRYAKIFILFFQHTLQYRARMFLWFLNAFINPLVLLLFWRGILKGNQIILGWTTDSIQTYYLLLIAAQATLLHHAEYLVAYEDIKQGNLQRELLRPFPYSSLRLISESPWRIVQGIYAIVSILIVTQLLQVHLHLTNNTYTVYLAIIIAILAYFISYLFKMILGFSAFWTTNIEGLMETSDVLILVLSGIVVPVNLFPTWLQNFTNVTPFPYMLYYPISAFIGTYEISQLLIVISVQFAWIVILLCLYTILWRYGVKKFEAIGQ